MKTIFNFFWVIFVGLPSAIVSALVGIAMCCTIIGIPFGLQHFKFIKLVFAPAGKVVATRYSKHPFMNTFWMLFGGFETGIFYMFLAIILLVTIIGIPISLQLMKIAMFNFAPFGAEIVGEGEYTSGCDTNQDFYLFFPRAAANLDMIVGTNPDGSPKLMAQVFLETRRKARLHNLIFRHFLTSVFFFAALLATAAVIVSLEEYFLPLPIMFIVAITPLAIVFSIMQLISSTAANAFYRKHFGQYVRFYPKGSPEKKGMTIDKIYAQIDKNAARR